MTRLEAGEHGADIDRNHRHGLRALGGAPRRRLRRRRRPRHEVERQGREIERRGLPATRRGTGPRPLTDSTATAPSTAPRVTRTPQPTGPAPASPTPTRTLSGATPGLYGGTARTGSCDVERQIAYLTRDQAKAGAFAGAEGISRSAIPGYLRGLTSVVLRADTQVTNHGFRDARVTGFQSVLQAGTAVLVDNRGVPRVRCACGNPLKAGVAGGSVGSSGQGWSG
ncbi:DUF6777 domain-containing protein [Streptomyces sp. L7]